MRAAKTLIPARFLALVGHLSVLVTLLWVSQQNGQACLEIGVLDDQTGTYQSRLPLGFAVSITFILLELSTFMLGLTMFSFSLSLLSITGHSIGTIVLTYFILETCLCEWFWIVYTLCSVVPAIVDSTTALKTLSKIVL